MLSVKGVFEDGAARPSAPVSGRDGQTVIITFLDDDESVLSEAEYEDGWRALERVIEETAIETGISDLAHQHDHYIHGTPKKP